MALSKNYSSHSVKLGLFLLAASALSGCGVSDAMLDDVYQPYGGSDKFPITVAKGPVAMEVSTAQGTLQPNQINAVTAFVHQAMQAGVTPITVARPSGGGASARVASEIASLMVQQGVPRAYVRFGTFPASSSAPVRLSYVSTYAATKPCGDWSEDGTDTEANNLMPNQGCAVQANIAAMVADPETLVIPATIDPIPAEPRVTAITAAMAGGTTTSSTSGTSSTAPAATP